MATTIIASTVTFVCAGFGVVALVLGFTKELKSTNSFFGFLFFMAIAYLASLAIPA